MNQIVKVCVLSLLIFILPSCDAIKDFAGISEPTKSDIQDIFKDDVLRECIARLTSNLQASEVRDIICAGVGITSLDGLEQFPNIRSLILNTNRLSQVDLSPFSNLEFLDLSANRFNEIDISHNPKLIEVFLDVNSLDELDTSKNILLEALVLSDNDLSYLDLSKNKNLEELIIDENAFVGDLTLGALDLSKNKKLINLNIFDNDITNIDLSENINLDLLDLRKNSLVEINLQNNTNISELRLNDNNLIEIDLTANRNINNLLLENNDVVAINLPSNGKLKFAHLRGNLISCDASDCNGQNYFVFPGNSGFIHLDLSDNLLSTDDLVFYPNIAFTELLISDNPLMTGELDLSLLTNMVEVRLDNTNITSIKMLGFTNASSVFNAFDFQVITAIGTPIDQATKDLLDDMEQQKINHPRYSDSESLFYIYELD